MSGDPIDLAHEADFSLGAVVVRPSLRTVVTNGAEELIEPRVMQVLVALARRRGEVVSRDDLIAQCWNGRVVGDDAISRPVAMARKLGETSGAFSIETIPRIGYRLKAADAAPETPAPAVAESAPQPSEPARSPAREPLLRRRHLLRSPKWVMGTGAALLAAVLTVTIWMLMNGGGAPGPVTRQVIAFYGFAAADAAPESAVIAANTTREVRDTLGAMRLETLAESDMRGVKPDERIAHAKALNALYVLSGEVRTEGDKTTVSIRLEDVPSHATIWPESTKGDKTDTIALPVQAAILATDTLSCTMHYRAGLRRDDPAVVALLPNICVTIRRNPPEIIQIFRNFKDKAPDSSYAQSNFAMGALLNLQAAAPESRDALLREIDDAIARSRELDPKDPDMLLARFTRAMIAAAPYAEMERLALEGLKIAPDDPTINTYYSDMLRDLGRFQEATPYVRAGAAFDPLSPAKTTGLALHTAELGQIAEAKRQYERVMQRTPAPWIWSSWVRAALAFHAGDADVLLAARPNFVAPEAVDCWRAAQVGFNHAPAPKRRQASDKVQACLDQKIMTSASAYVAFAALDDPTRAFALVHDRTTFMRDEGEVMFWLATANLRQDPRFAPLMEKLDILAYWRAGKRPDFCATENAPVCGLIAPK